MEKIAFATQLKPGCRDEYRRRHDAIWPELVAELRADGVSDYSIYLDEQTGRLFAVLRRPEGRGAASRDANSVVRRWWDYMADLVDTNPDQSPVVTPLTPMFHLP